ncbi:MAG: hypothetical protein KME21_22275 [Desmonostoc vinosum HA7617-LM4]|nr:hypothetical protein [Desmonostoc vinosum HA7617-LM4]
MLKFELQIYRLMKTLETSLTTKENKSAKKKQSSFPGIVGTPKVPFRKRNKAKQEHELLSDWNHAS